MSQNIEVCTGNIFDSGADIICHQVNCRRVMGAGLAYQIKVANPNMFREYKSLCSRFGSEMLGRAVILPMDSDPKHFIANCFGQCSYGTGRQHTEYLALESALNSVRDFACDHQLSVAIPYKMGCGLAGGTWSVVSDIISPRICGLQ